MANGDVSVEQVVSAWLDQANFDSADVQGHLRDQSSHLARQLRAHLQSGGLDQSSYVLERIERRQRIMFELLYAILNPLVPDSPVLAVSTAKITGATTKLSTASSGLKQATSTATTPATAVNPAPKGP